MAVAAPGTGARPLLVNLLILVGVVAFWIALQKWILPGMGVST